MLRVVESPEKFISQVISWSSSDSLYANVFRFSACNKEWNKHKSKSFTLSLWQLHLFMVYFLLTNAIEWSYNQIQFIVSTMEGIWIHWKRSRTGALLSIHHRHRPHQQKDFLYNNIHLSLYHGLFDDKMDTIVYCNRINAYALHSKWKVWKR